MKYKEDDILTVENKEYVVASILTNNGKDYLFLANIDDYNDTKFCLLEDDRLFEVLNKRLIDKLTLLVAKDTIKDI